MSKPALSCITLLGIGTIGGCVIQMVPDYFDLQELIIVDKVSNLESRVQELCSTSVFAAELNKVKLTVLKLDITESNYVELLGPLFAKSQAVIDLTTVCSNDVKDLTSRL